MKLIILIILSLTSQAQAGIFKKKYPGKIPTRCEQIFSNDYSHNDSSIEGEIAQTVRRSVLYSKKILDLKFETHHFLQENKAIYGDFIRLTQMKEDLDAQKVLVQGQKDEKIEKSNQLLLSLITHETDLAETIYKDISRERTREISRYNIALNNLQQHWLNMRTAYYRSVSRWAPYANSLEELNKLELALIQSLKHLGELHQIAGGILNDLTQELAKPMQQDEIEQFCATIDERLGALSKL